MTHFCQPEDIWDAGDLWALGAALTEFIDAHPTAANTHHRLRRDVRAALARLGQDPKPPKPEPESYDPVPEMAGPPMVDLLGALEASVNAAKAERRAKEGGR
jgi:hypothetical protein